MRPYILETREKSRRPDKNGEFTARFHGHELTIGDETYYLEQGNRGNMEIQVLVHEGTIYRLPYEGVPQLASGVKLKPEKINYTWSSEDAEATPLTGSFRGFVAKGGLQLISRTNILEDMECEHVTGQFCEIDGEMPQELKDYSEDLMIVIRDNVADIFTTGPAVQKEASTTMPNINTLILANMGDPLSVESLLKQSAGSKDRVIKGTKSIGGGLLDIAKGIGSFAAERKKPVFLKGIPDEYKRPIGSDLLPLPKPPPRTKAVLPDEAKTNEKPKMDMNKIAGKKDIPLKVLKAMRNGDTKALKEFGRRGGANSHKNVSMPGQLPAEQRAFLKRLKDLYKSHSGMSSVKHVDSVVPD